MPTTDIGSWGKFTLVLWKNMSVNRRKFAEMLISILTPMLFFIMLVIVRFTADMKTVPVTEYEDIALQSLWKILVDEITLRKESINKVNPSFTYNCFVPRPILAFAPNRYQVFNDIMEITGRSLYQTEMAGFPNCRELRKKMAAEHYIAGVCFNESTISASNTAGTIAGGFPKHLNYSLIFPSELRIYNDTFIGSHWNTNMLFYVLDSILPRLDRPEDGGFVGYAREGFLSLQDAIARAYVFSANKFSRTIWLRRFPHPLHNYDLIIVMSEISISLVLMAGLTYPIMRLTKLIVSEKESRITTVINNMGVSYWIIYLARFVNASLLMIARSLLTLLVIKVRWREGYAIYTKSSWFALLFLLLSYNIVSICFSFMISAFFSDSVTATIITGILWVITYIPYLPLSNTANGPNSARWLAYIFSNTAMGLALKCVNQLEQGDNGLHWSSLTESPHTDSYICFRTCIIIMYSLSIVYTCIALIVECKKPQHLLKMIFAQSRPQAEPNRNSNVLSKSRYFEADPANKVPTIRIKNLTRQLNGQTILKDITMNLQQDEITIIVGNDGSGKTLLISIIAGLTQPTYGTVLIDSFNVQTQRQLAYTNLGICIGDEMLFESLSVIEQLTFFGRLKGIQKDSVNGEVEKYLRATNMIKLKHKLTQHLTYGLKRQLAVCCALIGGSKFVLLDEPSTGMDFHARKRLWQMLKDEKKGRTILLSTNSTEELQILVDRVAVLSDGELKCYGTTAFVKNMDSQVYHLICIKGEYCNEKNVTELIQSFIPDVTPESEIGNEISYLLKKDNVGVFGSLFDDLEAKAGMLDMESFSICDYSLREVFQEMSAEKAKNDESNRTSNTLKNSSGKNEEDNQFPFFKKFEHLRGLELWANHLQALMLKHFLFDTRNRMLLIVQIFTPMLVTILTFILSTISLNREELKPMTFSLQQYSQSVTLLDSRANPLQNKVFENYENIILSMGSSHVLETIEGETFTSAILKKQESELENFSKKFLIGASYTAGKFTAWFNNYPLHTAPLTVNLLRMAMARDEMQDDGIVFTVTHDPLPFSTQYSTNFVNCPTTYGYLFAVNLTLCFSLIWSIDVIFLVKERATRVKLQQFISGVSVSVFWLTAFLYYIFKVTLMAVLVLLTTFALGHGNFLQLDIAVAYLMVMILTGACLFPLIYIVSTSFDNHINAYTVSIIINLLGSSIAWTLTEIEPKDFSGRFKLKEAFSNFCSFFPHVWMSFAFANIYRGNEMDSMCADKVIEVTSLDLDKCVHLPNCCVQDRLTNEQFGISSEIIHLFVFGIITGTIMCFMENQVFRRTLRLEYHIPDNTRNNIYQDHQRRHNLLATFGEDDGVTDENLRVSNLRPRDYYYKHLVCKNLTKKYSNAVAVENLHLVINRYECFCLQGGNGSGKSTLLKILSGDVKMSFGSVFVDGISLKRNPFKVFKRIGYCPQVDALLPEYTGHEFMKMHCLLRGMPRGSIDERCESLAKVLGFHAFYHKRISGYCSGNKRRLSCAIAMLGDPSIIYLDDPSSGIDAKGRKQLSQVIYAFCRKGTSVLITSWRLRECERVCNRLAFISHGHLLCIGARENIKNKYGKGYVLEVKLTNSSSAPDSATPFPHPYLKLATFVEREFTNSILKYHYGNDLIFLIPLGETRFSDIFEKIISNESVLEIGHFEIARMTLTTLFLDLEETERHLSLSSAGDDVVETHL